MSSTFDALAVCGEAISRESLLWTCQIGVWVYSPQPGICDVPIWEFLAIVFFVELRLLLCREVMREWESVAG